MSVKGTILENYQFDVRDFSGRQIKILKQACVTKGNSELQSKLQFAIQCQTQNRDKYLRRVNIERQDAYMKPIYSNLREKLHVPASIWNWVGSQKTKFDNFTKSLVPDVFSFYGQESMNWPEIKVDEESAHAPNIIASMPANCVNLTGWQRVKQAFFPEKYMEMFDPNNPTHTYNSDIFIYSTVITSSLVGMFQAYDHARRELTNFKKIEGTAIYESKLMAWRAKEHAFIKPFIRYTFRWGWRFSVLYAVTYLISQSMTIYKMEDKASHYVAGVGVSTALYAWKSGPVSMLKTGAFGAIVFGFPVGIMLGSLGFNPRPMRYFTKVEPRVFGPLSEEGRTLEKRLLSMERVLAILHLLEIRQYCPEINNSEFYRAFLGKD